MVGCATGGRHTALGLAAEMGKEEVSCKQGNERRRQHLFLKVWILESTF